MARMNKTYDKKQLKELVKKELNDKGIESDFDISLRTRGFSSDTIELFIQVDFKDDLGYNIEYHDKDIFRMIENDLINKGVANKFNDKRTNIKFNGFWFHKSITFSAYDI